MVGRQDGGIRKIRPDKASRARPGRPSGRRRLRADASMPSRAEQRDRGHPERQERAGRFRANCRSPRRPGRRGTAAWPTTDAARSAAPATTWRQRRSAKTPCRRRGTGSLSRSPKTAIRPASTQAFSGGCGWPRRSTSSPRNTYCVSSGCSGSISACGGFGEIDVIVALNGLIEKWQADQQNQPEHQTGAAFARSTPASIAAPACARR